MNMVKVIDVISSNCLFECPLEQREKAYKYASEMEEIGLDVKVELPSVAETLSISLGATEEEQKELKEVLEEEIASHIEPSCEPCLSKTHL